MGPLKPVVDVLRVAIHIGDIVSQPDLRRKCHREGLERAAEEETPGVYQPVRRTDPAYAICEKAGHEAAAECAHA